MELFEWSSSYGPVMELFECLRSYGPGMVSSNALEDIAKARKVRMVLQILVLSRHELVRMV